MLAHPIARFHRVSLGGWEIRRCVATVMIMSFMVGFLGSAFSVNSAPTNSYMVAVAVDAKGTMYGADVANKAVFRVTQGVKKIIAQGPGKPRTPLYAMRALIVDPAGGWLAADTATCEVYRIQPGGQITGLTRGEMNQPQGIVLTPKGEIYATDLGDQGLYRITEGKPVKVAAVDSPTGLALDKDGTFVVVSRGTNSLYRVSVEGKVTPLVRGRKFAFPHAVVVEPAGTYLVSDGYDKTIWRVTAQGQATVFAKSDLFKSPQGLAWEPEGNLLVADPHAKAIFRVTPAGKVTVAYQE